MPFSLLILRHGKSDWDPRWRSDAERPLKRRGRRATDVMATWMVRNGAVPDRIVASDAVRADQTARRAQARLQVLSAQTVPMHSEPRLYEASLATHLSVIRDYQRLGERRLLLVGHNPGLEDLIGFLCSPVPPAGANGKLLPTAALAVLNFSAERFVDRAGTVLDTTIVRPRELTGG